MDRGKNGTKRHVWVDRLGIPLSAVLSATNRHDMKALQAALQRPVLRRSRSTPQARQHLCLDQGNDYPECRR